MILSGDDFLLWRIDNVPFALAECFNQKLGELSIKDRHKKEEIEIILQECKEEMLHSKEEEKRRFYENNR